MEENLKKETAKGLIWSGIERFATSGIQFAANLILARLLTPSDFGLVAIIAIFITISQTFIDSGFSNALIQKKNRSQLDYSTVFVFNLSLAVFFYLILFFTAPFIAEFFNNELLTKLTRVVGLNLIIGALSAVQKTRLSIRLEFKIQSIISLSASIISAVVAITMAYKGGGVWSLVVLSLINFSIQTLLIFILIKWRPDWKFSFDAFKQLFSYSSKLLGASLIHLLYRNIYPIFIGKKFSARDLGFFNRADTFSMYIPSTISAVFSKVAFPIFSRIQDDDTRLSAAYSKYIIFSSLVIFPVMTGMLVMGKPLTLWILKEQWVPMIPLFQILCLDWMTDTICSINLNVLYVKGRSDLAFKLEIIKKAIAITIFFISLPWGLIGVCWGRVVYSLIAVYINSFYTKRLIGISLWQQLRDIAIPLLQSIGMGVVVALICTISMPLTATVISGVAGGIAAYLLIIFLTKREYLLEFSAMIRTLRNGK